MQPAGKYLHKTKEISICIQNFSKYEYTRFHDFIIGSKQGIDRCLFKEYKIKPVIYSPHARIQTHTNYV